MFPGRIRRILGLFLLAGALPVLLWGLWPSTSTSLEINASPDPNLEGLPTGDFSLELAWTERVRFGDSGEVRAKLLEQALVGQSSWIAEARLDLPEVRVEPGALLQSPRLMGEPLSFSWTIHPEKPGSYSGRVWVFMLPVRSGGEVADETDRSPLAALPLELQVTRMLWLSGPGARAAGMAGFLAGFILNLDLFLSLVRRAVRLQRNQEGA